MTDPTKPSEAAMRAAKAIYGATRRADYDGRPLGSADIAAIIDRETRCGEMREALELIKRETHRGRWSGNSRDRVRCMAENAIIGFRLRKRKPTP